MCFRSCVTFAQTNCPHVKAFVVAEDLTGTDLVAFALCLHEIGKVVS